MGFLNFSWPDWLPIVGKSKKQKQDVQTGGELPVGFHPNMTIQIPEWDDPVYNVDTSAYKLMRTSSAINQPIKKLGDRICALDLNVVGPVDRAGAVKQILDQSFCFPELVKFLIWGFVEGVVFCQINKNTSREGPDVWVVPDFQGGARHKRQAGGSLIYDWHNLYKIDDSNTVVNRSISESQKLITDDFIIFRPGIGSNPHGDLDTVDMFFRLAEEYQFIKKTLRAYADRHGLPREIIKKNIDRVAASAASGVLRNAASSVAGLGVGAVVGLTVQEILEYIEPKGTGADFLLEYLREISQEIHRLILNQDLTSSTKDAGPAGSSKVHKAEEDLAIKSVARQIAECLNRCLLPWIFKNNPDIPELGESDEECYIEFVEVEDEDDAEVAEEDDAEDGKELEPKGDIKLGINPVPPVHPNCACSLDGGVWQMQLNACDDCQDAAAEFGLIMERNNLEFVGNIQDAPVEGSEGIIMVGNPYAIHKVGSQYCVVKRTTGKKFGCHGSKADAIRQLAAIEMHTGGK